MQFAWRGWILCLLGGMILVGLLNIGVGFLALKRLEGKAGSPIRGRFVPHLFRPAFSFQDPSFGWQGRFQVHSGTFVVHYDPFFILPGHPFRVQVAGRELAVRLLGDLAQSQGLSEVKVDRVEADFAFSKGKTPEIYKLHVQSPQLQFDLVRHS